MKTEIERKFLVSGRGFEAEASGCSRLVQGYLCRESGRTVRVRVEEAAGRGADGARGWLTVKGRSTADGTSRSEWEWEIPAEDARGLLGLCTGKVIVKDRYFVPARAVPDSGEGSDAAEGAGGGVDGLKWEVDVFHGAHEGLTLAEIELDDPGRGFVRPEWLGAEVTGDRRYYNSVLSAE